MPNYFGKRFAVAILTHGRPNDVITYEALMRQGYTGDVRIIIDNEDKQADAYYKRFGKDNVTMFDKLAVAKTTDTADTQSDRRAAVFARNASFKIMRDLGYEYFMQLDDDYTNFYYRKIEGKHLYAYRIKNLDKAFDALIKWHSDSRAATVAMAQGGELIGGVGSALAKSRVRRKAMNSWLFRTDEPMEFMGRMNDDVNTYVMNGIRGKLIMTPYCMSIAVAQTQAVAGGMTEMYLDTGTYMKSFYTVMMAPASVSVRRLGPAHPRAHHHIEWNNCVPKIIEEIHRKPRQP